MILKDFFQSFRIVQRKVLCDDPVLQKNYTVAGRQDKLIIMGDDDGCVLSPCNRNDQVADAHHAVIIKAAGRLVENVDALI